MVLLRGDTLEGAIATTVAYYDVFTCAPRLGEIHRFLIGHGGTRRQVERALQTSPELEDMLQERQGFWFLRGKDHLVPRRIRFLQHCSYLWPEARRIARFVERSGIAVSGMVTGSLSADNSDEHADIDFLFIYPENRTWSSYAALRLIKKLPRSGLGKLCPNYALPSSKLEIRPQSLFTAFEIAKAVPLFGHEVYAEFASQNVWVKNYMPNALPVLEGKNSQIDANRDPTWLRPFTDNSLFRRIERIEKRRKFDQDLKDVGVDMDDRLKQGSVDRHSPTRSFHAMSELRYRMDLLGLEGNPVYAEIGRWTQPLGEEMVRWGVQPLQSSTPVGPG